MFAPGHLVECVDASGERPGATLSGLTVGAHYTIRELTNECPCCGLPTLHLRLREIRRSPDTPYGAWRFRPLTTAAEARLETTAA